MTEDINTSRLNRCPPRTGERRWQVRKSSSPPCVPLLQAMTIDNTPENPKPHFVLIPLMAQGHTIPMVDMARLLADRGAAVSFITTPVNASRIKPLIDSINDSGLPIRFLQLPFPCVEAGLPDGCENLDLILSADSIMPFFQAASMLGDPVELYLRQQPSGPTCMISDWCHPWTAEIARKLNIPRFVFHGPSCFYLLCVHNIRRHGIYDRITDQFEPFEVPDLPHRSVVVTRAQSPGFFDQPGLEKLRDEALEAEAAADGVVLNSFDELEPWIIESYRKATGKKVWAIGPLSLHNKDTSYNATRGNKAAVDKHRVLSWLDSMAAGSVIYVSFGSLARNSPSQLIEIGAGLEASNSPFIWVVKEAESSPEVEKWLSEGFEERTRDRGLLIKGWAPQVMILSHPAVGGFVTHCGWNSTLEAVSAGVPVITWPHFADQFLNEKLTVEVVGTGVSIGSKVPTYHITSDSDVVQVKRDNVEKAVVSLMDGGEEGKGRRERARELGEKAKAAMDEGGSSYDNLTHLIQYTLEHQNKNFEEKEI